MNWANFLHIYQPAGQTEEIFEKVVQESYRPLVRILLDNPSIKLTLNINAALTEQLELAGFNDVIDGIRTALERGQLELTDTAKYHALLPFLPEEEIIRQIELNRKTNQKIFGPAYKPAGFFPPEMAYSPKLAPILSKMGYKWIILDEIAYNGKSDQVDYSKIYKIDGTDLKVFFRERQPSNLIMGAYVRHGEDLIEKLKDRVSSNTYLVTGMDGETFGHHRPGLQDLLKEVSLSNSFKHVFFSELIDIYDDTKTIAPVASTWASTEESISKGIQFQTWMHPENPIHGWQWELQGVALDLVRKYPDASDFRIKLDSALSSDQFYWASAWPWWSAEEIERGAWMLLDAIKSIPNIDHNELQKAEAIYYQIIEKTFEWQRTGYIKSMYRKYKQDPRIPFKERANEQGEPWVFDAFISLMRESMEEASKKENYEEAILWRDAIWKLETKNDIYDSLHAVDLLRTKITNEKISQILEKYREDYLVRSQGQPEAR